MDEMEFIMPNELQSQITEISSRDMIRYFHKGWTVYFNSVPPSRESIWILLSYWAIVTDWGSNIYNYNVGNIPSEDGDGYDYIYRPECKLLKIDEAKKLKNKDPGLVSITYNGSPKHDAIVWFLPSHKFSRFRAYQSISEGIVDYFCRLVRSLPSETWKLVREADAGALAADLERLGWVSEPLITATGCGFADALGKYLNAYKTIEFDYDSLTAFTDDEKEQIKNLIGFSLIEMEK